MTQLNQDFTIYQGDAGAPQFTVLDGDGAGIDISGVSDIIWQASRTADSVPVLVKRKTVSAGITFVTNGTDGKFQVNFTGTDTTPLSGYYVHEALLLQGADQSTVALGRFRVGRAPSWSYSGDPANSTLDAIRFMIGDTDGACPQLEDGEVNYSFAQIGNVYGAAAMCCQVLATNMSRLADQSSGQSKLTYSQRATAYAKRAREFEFIMAQRGGAVPYAGGISIADRQRQEQDPDRSAPQFSIGEDDNFVPLPSSGNETLDEAGPGNPNVF